jgi:hypothetical protein
MAERRRWHAVGLAAWLTSAAAAPAAAANDGQAAPDLLLGPVPTYPTEAEARSACGKDAVVWADRYAGYYYLPGEAKFGATPDGAYACKKTAAQANYWDTDPRGSMSGQPGRVFPYRPLYVGS